MDSVPQQLLLQVFLIALNAVFAATEIAVISLNAGKLRHQAEEGDSFARKMLPMVEEPAGFLSTIQIGITLAGFLGSAFAADNFSEPLVEWVTQDLGFTQLPVKVVDTIAVILITLVLSYFTLIFGELVPKRVAMQKPLAVAKLSCNLISVLSTLMRPVIWFLSASTNGTLRLLGINPSATEEPVTEEEIRLMVDLGEEKGTINPEEKELIDNIFEFNNTSARDAMTRTIDIEAIQKDTPSHEIVELIQKTGLSRFPVYGTDLNDIVGILSTREYLLNLQSDTPKPLEALLRPAYFVPDSIHTDQLFRDLQKKKLHIAIVVDEFGETCGLITMEDLLEEIVGNIYDEFDPLEEAPLQQLGENLWRASGSIDAETLFEQLDLPLPEDCDFDTLGGLIFSQLHTIPKDGTVLDISAYGLEIHVEKIQGRRVEQVTLKKQTGQLTSMPLPTGGVKE